MRTDDDSSNIKTCITTLIMLNLTNKISQLYFFGKLHKCSDWKSYFLSRKCSYSNHDRLALKFQNG